MNTAIQPAIRPDYSPEQRATWMQRHEEFVALARGGNIDVVFLGDSITDYWRDRGRASWDRYFAPLRAANFGIPGDRTQQVLWRIDGGEIARMNPKVVVLLIGTNNLTPGLGENSLTPKNTPAEIVAGVAAIIAALRRNRPRLGILLHGLLPRDGPGTALRRDVIETNAGLMSLADAIAVRFLDLGATFLNPNGTIPEELMPDGLHLSARGYALWADALHQPLRALLTETNEIHGKP